MAQFTVDVAKLRTALSDLQKDHKDFNSEVDDLKKSEKTLSGKWEGDAKEAFEKAFLEDAKYMDDFSSLLTKYEETLQKMIEAYEAAARENVRTGSTRSFGK